jgi:hypothetical protein
MSTNEMNEHGSIQEAAVYFKKMIEDVARIPAVQVEERLDIELNRLHDALGVQAAAASSMTSSIDKLINQIGVSDAALHTTLKDVKRSLEEGIDSRLGALELALSSGASDLSTTVSQTHSVLVQRVEDVMRGLKDQQRLMERVLWSTLLAGALAVADLIVLLTRH